MTPEEQKRRGISDEDRKFIEERESAARNKAKREGGFYDKPIYKSSTPSNDPLKREPTKAEEFARGARGGAK